jgi:putative transposase
METSNRRGQQDTERRRAAITALLGLRNRESLTTAHADAVAQELGVTRRTVWRWLAGASTEGVVGQSRRARHEVTKADIKDLAYWHGNIAALHRDRALTDGPSVWTLRRAFERALSPGQRAGLAGGEGIRRRFDTYLTRTPHHRNECWEADHGELAIEVLLPDGHVISPWLTVFADTCSRMVCGWAIAEVPSQESVLAALRAAILTAPPHGPAGGVPERIRWDRGREFLANAVTTAATALAIDARALPAYSPHLKGAIERLLSSIEGLLLAELPGFLHGPRGRSGRRIDEGAPLLTLDHFVELFAAFIHRYNTSHSHAGLEGEAPLERWTSDATPLTEVPAELLHHLLLARVPRIISKRGIRLFGRVYNAAELVGWVGQSVEVRYMPHRLESVEVFHDGEHLATAWWVDAMEEAEARRVLERRAEEARWLARQHRAAARRRREHFAPMTEPRPPRQKRTDGSAPPRSLTPSRSLVDHGEIPAHMVRPPELDRRCRTDASSKGQ